MLRIVRGNPSEEEIAALTALLVGAANASRAGTRREVREARPSRSAWGDLSFRLRDQQYRRPLIWRGSALPR